METAALFFFSTDGITLTAKHGDRSKALSYRSHTSPTTNCYFQTSFPFIKTITLKVELKTVIKMSSPQIKCLKTRSACYPTLRLMFFYEIWALLQLITGWRRRELVGYNSSACKSTLSPWCSTCNCLNNKSRAFCFWEQLPALTAGKYSTELWGFHHCDFSYLTGLKSFCLFHFNNTVNIYFYDITTHNYIYCYRQWIIQLFTFFLLVAKILFARCKEICSLVMFCNKGPILLHL